MRRRSSRGHHSVLPFQSLVTQRDIQIGALAAGTTYKFFNYTRMSPYAEIGKIMTSRVV